MFNRAVAFCANGAGYSNKNIELYKKEGLDYMLKSKVFIITLLTFSLLSIFLIQKREVIFQEGNPIPLAIAASKMILQNKEIVKIEKKDESDLYLVKQGELDPFIQMMKKNGWELINRSETQNLLVFEKGNNSMGVGYKYYTRYYTIINSPGIN